MMPSTMSSNANEKSTIHDNRRRISSGILVCLFAVLLAIQLAACRVEEGPESALKKAVTEAETAAETREVKTLMAFIAEDYLDTEGRNREGVTGIFRYYFLRNQAIHLLTRIQAIELINDKEAHMTLLVAMAGEPIDDPNDPALLRASLYRFDLEFFQYADGWKVRQAAWQHAQAGDFIPQ